MLARYRDRDDVVVLALPRGGVPVAREVARALGVPFDVFVVRKLGVPGHEELAMGAIASGGVRLLNRRRRRRAGHSAERDRFGGQHVSSIELERREQSVSRQSRRRSHSPTRRSILVDDGLATGSTMRAAVMAVRQQQPARVIVGRARRRGVDLRRAWPARPTKWCACARPIRSSPSACGIATSRRRPIDEVRRLLGNRPVTWPSSNLYRHLIVVGARGGEPFNAATARAI